MLTELDRLLPHRPPMRLIDRILRVDEQTAAAELTVRLDNPFLVADQGLPAWVAIEIMAQCTAAIGGARAAEQGGRAVPGYLLGCRDFRCTRPWFRVGERLEIRGKELMRDAGALAVYRAQVLVDEQCIASARLNVHTGEIL